MGAVHSQYAKSRRKSALRVLEAIKPRIPNTEKSRLNLLDYLHAYISSASSPTYHSISLGPLERKLQKYISSAIKSRLGNGRSSFFQAQFDEDQTQLAIQLSYAKVCVEDLELFEQILTAVRRKEVLPFGEFIVERPAGQIGRVRSMHLQMQNELEFSILHGPAGGYASTKSPDVIPWWENKEEAAQLKMRQPARHNINRTVSSICSTPDNFKIRHDTPTRPLSHSTTMKESRSPTLRPSTFSFSSESTVANPPASSNSTPNSHIQSIESTILSSRDWLDNTTSAPSQPAPENKNSSAVTHDNTYTNPRDSWTSSIYSESSLTTESTMTPIKTPGSTVNHQKDTKTPPSPISPMTINRSKAKYDESPRTSSVDSDSTDISSAPSLGPSGKITSVPSSSEIINLSKTGEQAVARGNSNRDKKRHSEPDFGALYRVRYGLDRAMDGVRISLTPEDLAEVRIEEGGSYVRVDAWVPLGNVYNHLDFQNVRRIRASR